MKMPWVLLILIFPIMGVGLYLLIGLNGGTHKDVYKRQSILYAEYQIVFPFRKLLFYQAQYFLIMEIVRYEV